MRAGTTPSQPRWRLRCQRFRLGAVEDESTDLGPLINHATRDRVQAVVAEAAEMGCAPLVGGIPGGELAAGSYLAPSIVAVEQLDSSFVQEEFFGPVMNSSASENDAEAVSKANATRYGLAASVWTPDLARAHRVARKLRSGTVWIQRP